MSVKLLIPSILAVVAASCASSPEMPRKTDAERAELKGPVRTVSTDFVANAKDEWGQVDERHIGSETYGPSGNLIEDEEYTPDFIKKRTPERKDAGTTVFHSQMGDSTVHDTYDPEGNVVEEEVRYGIRFDGPADTLTRFKFDENGREKERDYLGPGGKMMGAFLYRRDESGNVIEEEDWLNDRKSPHARMVYRYDFDAHGNWVKRYEIRKGVPQDDYSFGRTGTLIRTITYYDGPPVAAH